MIGFAVLFGLLAVFLAQTWLNNQSDARMRSLEAQHKAPPPERTIVVANRPLRFGDELTAQALREVPWPQDALPAGSFNKIADLTAGKRVVLIADRRQRADPCQQDHRSGPARHAVGDDR